MSRNRKIAFAAVGALGAAALAIPALAGPSDGRGMRGDLNADGVVTRDEARTAATQMFAKMDANKDGKLSPEDRTARQAARFDAMDTNKDGSLSRAEFDAAHAARADRWAQRGEGAGPDGARGGPDGHRGKHGMRGGKGPGMGKMADTNNDGAVTEAEMQTAAMAHFDKADANKDGKLTQDERRAAHKAMRDAMGKR